MAIQGPKTPIHTNVNPINTTGTGQAQPATSTSGVSQQPPVRDGRADAAGLNRIAPQQGAFRVGLAGRTVEPRFSVDGVSGSPQPLSHYCTLAEEHLGNESDLYAAALASA